MSMLPENSEQRSAFLKTLKLALAMAIIRTKPKKFTAKQYASDLATAVREAKQCWKTKLTELQEELLATKQELFIAKLETTSNAPNSVCTRTDISPDHTNYKESSNSNHEPNQEYNENFDLKTCDLHKHCRFFGLVMAIQNWSNLIATSSTSSDADDVRHVFYRNLLLLLESFQECLVDVDLLNDSAIHMLKKAVKIICRIANSPSLLKTDIISEPCSSIVQALVRRIMTDEISDNKIFLELSSMTIELSSSCLRLLRDDTLEKLLCMIQTYADSIKSARSICDVNMDRYERIYYVCRITERVIQKTCKRWPIARKDFSNWLEEETIFSIAENFQLFSRSMWRIHVLLSYDNRTGTNNADKKSFWTKDL